MIKLLFSFNREPMTFIIKDREIFYSDRYFKNMIRCIPPPENLIKMVALSRNRISANFINMFKFTEEEIKEYKEAKDEKALADIIIKDAKSRGCIFIKPIDNINMDKLKDTNNLNIKKGDEIKCQEEKVGDIE